VKSLREKAYQQKGLLLLLMKWKKTKG